MSISAVERIEKRVAGQTIENAQKAFGLKYVELASALGVDRRTLLRYRRNLSVPSEKVRARMGKIREIRHLMEEVFKGSEAQLEWLYSPVPLLRGQRPIDLMRKGKLDEVLSVLAGLYSGSFS
ncbi:MbcA/ParS/Xre antitoxin family protein [Desulfobacterota bacterium AH_259_B03_O07]|nr:MbcA/ParS/Xre antitoxin family protein [Desulfobacterota bacterium AH_259_B03_O07]